MSQGSLISFRALASMVASPYQLGPGQPAGEEATGVHNANFTGLEVSGRNEPSVGGSQGMQ